MASKWDEYAKKAKERLGAADSIVGVPARDMLELLSIERVLDSVTVLTEVPVAVFVRSTPHMTMAQIARIETALRAGFSEMLGDQAPIVLVIPEKAEIGALTRKDIYRLSGTLREILHRSGELLLEGKNDDGD